MKKSYYGLKIKDNKKENYGELGLKTGLLTVHLGNICESIYYYLSPFEKEPLWLETDIQTVENALLYTPDYKDDSEFHFRPFLTDTNCDVKIELEDIEIIRIIFSIDKPDKFAETCFILLHKESINSGKFIPLGWEASSKLDHQDTPFPVFGEDSQSPIYTFANLGSYTLTNLRDEPEYYGMSKDQLNDYELKKLYIILGR